MTEAEAIKMIMVKSDDWLCEKMNDHEFFEIIESYIMMVKMESNKPKNVECPDCGGEMQPRKSQYGMFWGCKKYPKCKGTRDSEGKSKLDREMEKAEQEPLQPIDERYRFRKG